MYDFLFENQLADLFVLDDDFPSGVIEDEDGDLFHNLEPIAIKGSVAGQDTQLLVIPNNEVPTGADVSMLLRSSADLTLTVSIGGNEIDSSARSGEDVEEAVHFSKPVSGNMVVEITNEGVLLGDLNGGQGDMWDTHGDNFNRLRHRLLPVFDQGFAALLDDLAGRNTLD